MVCLNVTFCIEIPISMLEKVSFDILIYSCWKCQILYTVT